MNVPLPASSFVGRTPDVERALELLASPSRVVTLFGPAGIGKTRLATRVAHDASARFQGAWFVAVAEARTESAFVSAVAAALGDSTADVGYALAGRGKVLVVLDNVEQVAASAADAIARWVRLAPDARFLVTSRERLRIESEACLELAPLERQDAVRLFIDRAAIVCGQYVPDEAESRAIGELVRRLDGNPLAIELAAARTKMFSASELLARIDKRFELLTGGPRDRTPRQGSLRGAIDWSWELLTDPEKRALARCSVFRGGFSAAAAENVVGGLAELESLVDKSLVRGRDGRFVLDETVRDYAAMRLTEAGSAEHDDAADRHMAFYAALANARAAELRGERAQEAAVALRVETDNVLSAHRRLRDRDRKAATTVALALNTLVGMRGPVEMQRELLETAVEDSQVDVGLHVRALVARARARLVRGETGLAEADAALALETATKSQTLRALALETHARIEVELGRSERARIEADEALALHVAAADRAGEATALTLTATVSIKQGRLDVAREILERALALQRERGDRVAIMSLLSNLGIVHHWQDRDEEAKRCYRAALEVAVAIGDRREESVDRINLALLLMDEGDLDEARSEFERALAIQRAAGHRQYVGNTMGSLGSLDLVEGNAASARRHFEESLTIIRELGHRRYEAATYRYLGIVALEEGDLDRALRSLELARTVADEVGDLTSFVEGPLGAALALLGRDAGAADAFKRARTSLATRGEPRAFVLLEIFEAFALVARGDLDGARAVVTVADKRRLASDARVALRLLKSAVAKKGGQNIKTIAVGEEARWFRVDAEAVDLSKRRAPRLILRRLAEARRTRPGEGITLEEIIAAGWPGERIQTEAAAARAYTAIKTLRELGLGDLLQRRDDGYLLDPAAKLT